MFIGCTGQIHVKNPEKDSFFVIRYRDQESCCLVSLIINAGNRIPSRLRTEETLHKYMYLQKYTA